MDKKLLIGGILVFVIIAALASYLLSPLFYDRVVDEDSPLTYFNDGVAVNRLSGSFVDADAYHKTSGKVFFMGNNDEGYVRFEDFSTTNGPDLYVYLSHDLDASKVISLGKLKGNVGNQNYEVEPSVSVDEYPYVIIWCKQFGVLFGSARLS